MYKYNLFNIVILSLRLTYYDFNRQFNDARNI